MARARGQGEVVGLGAVGQGGDGQCGAGADRQCALGHGTRRQIAAGRQVSNDRAAEVAHGMRAAIDLERGRRRSGYCRGRGDLARGSQLQPAVAPSDERSHC
jgi:hypothetical protein